MAMLVLAHAAFPGKVIAATVDHRLRAASADEARMVAAYCAELGVPHRALVPEAPIAGSSIQARAREARYALLREWCSAQDARALLTAHHADDQAETFLMRAARGSGISGLASIRERREAMMGASRPMTLLRPLLGWRRSELRQVAERSGAPFVDDPSNSDPGYDRTRFRRLLEENDWLDVSAIARTAVHAADADRALRTCADIFRDDCVTIEGAEIRFDARDLPREIQRRMVRDIVLRLQGEGASPANVEALLDSLAAGRGASQGEVMASAKEGIWTFRPAPPRRSH